MTRLTVKQRSVVKGISVGLVISGVVVFGSIALNPFAYHTGLTLADRLTLAFSCLLLPLLFMLIAVGRVAKCRFVTPEDIDGSGLSTGSAQVRILQALLQNSLEQLVIALVVYLAWALLMPGDWMSVLPLAACTFALGRLLFFVGYGYGAGARSLGFALSFYPSLMMVICLLGQILIFWRS